MFLLWVPFIFIYYFFSRMNVLQHRPLMTSAPKQLKIINVLVYMLLCQGEDFKSSSKYNTCSIFVLELMNEWGLLQLLVIINYLVLFIEYAYQTLVVYPMLQGCTKLRNEIEMQRTKRNETKRNITQRNILKCETKRNETKYTKMRNATKYTKMQNETKIY